MLKKMSEKVKREENGPPEGESVRTQTQTAKKSEKKQFMVGQKEGRNKPQEKFSPDRNEKENRKKLFGQGKKKSNKIPADFEGNKERTRFDGRLNGSVEV